jgi:putative transposase
MPKGIKNTEEQIIAVLKQADAGVPVQDLCRQQNISTYTFYKWKSKFGGMEVSDAKRLRSLEEENRKLKTIVADLTLDVQALRALSSKNFLSPR